MSTRSKSNKNRLESPSCVKSVVLSDQTNTRRITRSQVRAKATTQESLEFTTNPLSASISGMNLEENRNNTNNELWQMEAIRLPTRGPKSEFTELRWAKMNPIEWIDDLKVKAKSAEELSTGGGTPLKNPMRTPTSNKKSTFMALSPAFPSVEYPSYEGSLYESPDLLQSPFLVISSSDDSNLPPDVDKLLSNIDVDAMPQWWDFRSLQPCPSVERIRALVLAIEGQPKFLEMKSTLEQTRDHFTFSLSQLKAYHGGQYVESFELLCQGTIDRLQSILVLLVKGHDTSPIMTTPITCTGETRSSPATANKEAFQLHMNNWLRANWFNPYPDEAVSHQLAYETGENVHVVNTWLVNARSRRWRPSILKAFELNRPSEFLLEDSINIFEAKQVRRLDSPDPANCNKRTRLE